MSKQSKTEPCAVSAVRWSALSKYGALAVQFAVSLLLARILSPESFGLIGMATVMTGFAATLKNLGFSAAIIQRDDIDHALLSTLFWVNLACSALIMLVLILSSPLVGWVYHDDRVPALVAALSLNIVINSFCTVPSALLQRRLEFKKLALREVGGVIASGVVGVSCAIAGLGVWSLVAANLAASLSNLALLNMVEPFWPTLTLDGARLKECLNFGLNITGFNVFNYFMRNSDNLIVGVFLGPVALGYYSLAYKFMLLPRDSISNVITRVLFPKLSNLKKDDEGLASVFLRAIGCTALITFPAMAGLAILADPFVRVFLGDKWLPAVPVIAILAPVGAFHSLATMVGQIYLAKGRADWMFKWGVGVSFVFMFSFLSGMRWGVVGVASCYLVANVLLCIPVFSIPFTLVQSLTIERLWQTIKPLALATLLMAVGLKALLLLIDWKIGQVHPGAVLAVSVVVGMTLYSVILCFTQPRSLDDCFAVLGRRPPCVVPFATVIRR
ncbi:colanic acid exporter [Rhodopirellula maiorica SM1]|uniref:Colanic acid exporter n=1 Tax=Rhodopirellula maiorica SM1 TaxID=1265738 RepID=M5RQQ0_9BACT|nr:MOP flippase family protein [Rhodopirellula maiorica]EMI21541.1 colanic acid exporter [Rhodopirellula maiorica SM1]